MAVRTNWMRSFALGASLALLAGCGPHTGGDSGSAAGGIRITIVWPKGAHAEGPAADLAPMPLAAPSNVVTMQFTVTGPGMDTVQQAFAASAGHGTIDGIPAGAGRTLSVSAINAGGNQVYAGSIAGISVGNGRTTDAGTMTLKPFAPGLWTWVAGETAGGGTGVYGTQGVAAAGNVPPARSSSFFWRANDGTLWLFGGVDSISGGQFSDFWKFDGAEWTWISGSATLNQAGVYGTKGVAAPGNIPGGRLNGVTWVDGQGNLWLFGGTGRDSAGNPGLLNDLWKFDGSQWTWVSGANTIGAAGVYGTQGVAAPGNVPSARGGSSSWSDGSGNLWLFGGSGGGLLNDLWKFDGTQWTWVSGANTSSAAGVYGTKGVPAPGNAPGARLAGGSWVDRQGNLWLFGGQGYDGAGGIGILNDLWKFDGTTWTWVSGSSGHDDPGVSGTKGIAAPGNVPGSRYSPVTWTDSAGNLWLFGGYGTAELNNLWKFDGGQWTWVSGEIAGGVAGVYGTEGESAASNYPGSRRAAAGGADGDRTVWIFGGIGWDANHNQRSLNDLWRYTTP